MKNVILAIPIICIAHSLILAQCDDYLVKGSHIFHGNDIRTVILTGGDMFWDLGDARFQVPYRGPETPSAIFAAAVWFGGYDDSGNLRLSAQKHRLDRIDVQEYAPGPLLSTGFPLNVDCALWDTIWSVTREEILLHIEDYAQDGVIDNPQRSIFGWPGFKNMSFASVNGFLLPNEPQGYAPFFDADQDAYYEPEDGEYPLPHGLPALAIPDQITWHVFNDVRMHWVSSAEPTHTEFQQTCYAFYCPNNPLISKTLFVDFQIINRSTTILDSTIFSLWMDPDLGCYTDDFVGCVPDANAFMAYNGDATDGGLGGNCQQGVLSYVEGPPVISGSFLNREMSSFMYFFSGAPVIPPMEDPNTYPLEFYYVMNAHWRDGSPLSVGGTGYIDPPNGVPTSFAFPGDPNMAGSWAMNNVTAGFLENRIVASTKIGVFEPGQSERISLAFALHLDPSRNHLGNVTLMYEELPLIKEQFINGFQGCNIVTEPCLDDCVYAGDANHDGIADNLDILDIGIANGLTGPARNAPLSWAPYRNDDWPGSVTAGVNMKHADCDGDGVVEYEKEIGILDLHYGRTHDGYQQDYIIESGEELIVEGGFELMNPQTFATQTSISLNPDLLDELYGVAFTIVYDTYFFSQGILDAWSPFDPSTSDVWRRLSPGKMEYAAVRLDGQDESIEDKVRAARFFLLIRRNDLIPGQNDTTWVHLANIRGVLHDGTEIDMGAGAVRFVFLEEPSSTASGNVSPVKLYPNPSTGKVYFEVPEEMIDAIYNLYSISGEIIDTGRIQNGPNVLQLNEGVYSLVIRNDEKCFVEKIVVVE